MAFSRALIIGSSGGIGATLMAAPAAPQVVGLSRRVDGLDLTDEASIRRAALGLQGPFDLIIDATGALELDGVGPEKTIAAIDPDVMARQFAVNAIGPALLLKHFSGHLATDRPAVFATLSARVGSIGDNRLGGWISYRSAKAALNQIVRTAAIEMTRQRKQSICVAIHPGTVRTPLTEKYVGGHPAVSPAEAAAHILRVIATLTADDTGGFFDWRGDAVPW